MSKQTQGFTIPWETADQITVASLRDHRDYLKKELKRWKKDPKTDANPKGYWLHPEDVVKNGIMIEHMTAVLEYYGDKS
jgi:hypothetical protein